jgi:D-glycero-D-manno-heptose 1,7-bisphosphate phosphatase
MRPGVLLDRDGTLIDIVRDEETGTITTAFHPSQLRLLAGVVAGLQKLTDHGYVLAIATNQPGPAKGHFSAAAVGRTNDALVGMLADHGVVIAAVASCLHHPDGGQGGDRALVGPCRCRKPKPGLLDDLVRDLSLDRTRSWMVGDTRSDVTAGRAAGLSTALLFPKTRCELCPLRGGAPLGEDTPTVSGGSFPDVVSALLAHAETVL